MEENGLVEKKLSFFQRIRKTFFMMGLSRSSYQKAPDYLKTDKDVIAKLMSLAPGNINLIPDQDRIEYIKDNPGLFDALDKKYHDEILGNMPELASRLRTDDFLTRLQVKPEYENFIKYLSKDLQIKLLTDKVNYYDERLGSYKDTDSSTYIRMVDKFPPEVIEEAIILTIEKEKQDPNNKRKSLKDIHKQNKLLRGIDLKALPVDTQIKLTLLDNNFIEQMSPEALEKFIDGNPLLLKNTPRDFRIEYILKHPEFIKTLDFSAQTDIFKSIDQSKLTDDLKIMMANRGLRKYPVSDSEAFKKFAVSLWKYRDWNTHSSTDILRDQEGLTEFARFEPEVLGMAGATDTFTNYLKMGHVVDLFKAQTQDPEIQKALDSYLEISRRGPYDLETDTKVYGIAKVLLNKTVLKTCDPKLISEFISNPEDEKFKEIIITTYGDRAKQILEDRPMLSMNDIVNLDIFDPIVEERFGKGITHNLLSYNGHAPQIVGELVRHPEKMARFNMFEKAMGDFYNESYVDFESKMCSYFLLDDFLKNVKEEDLTPERIEALKVVAVDLQTRNTKGRYCNDELAIIPLESLEDLDKYQERRDKIYDDVVKRSQSPEEIKEAMSRKLFGMKYGYDSVYTTKTLTMKGMIKYYNLESFVNDERTINSEEFSQDDLDTLELFTIINKVEDPEVLKQIYFELSSREDVLKVTDIKELAEKIPLQYSKELVSTLTTPEEAKRRADSGEQGISYTVNEDGVEVITLDGAPFRVIDHTTAMSTYRSDSNSGLTLPKDKTPLEIWTEYEDGCSTVSGCLIEDGLMYSCENIGDIHFGFSSLPAKQIIGMSPYDAHTSHIPREVDPYFEYGAVSFNYPEELIRKTAAQVSGVEQKDVSHPYNETAFLRRDTDATGIEDGTGGGRIMPDFIISYGEPTPRYTELAKQFSKNGKPIPILVIHKEKYYDRAYQKAYQKEDHSTQRDDGETLKTVKNMTTKDDDDQR